MQTEKRWQWVAENRGLAYKAAAPFCRERPDLLEDVVVGEIIITMFHSTGKWKPNNGASLATFAYRACRLGWRGTGSDRVCALNGHNACAHDCFFSATS